MNEIICHQNIEEAMQQTLLDIRNYGHITSPRGRESKELIGYNFIIDNPRARIAGFKERDLNLYFALGNFLYIAQQSNKLEVIKYYNPRGVNFSDDGETLRGGYGKRIFDIDGVNQWNQVIKELKIDPDSRRAIITIHLPKYDWAGSLDTPCTASFQVFIRDGKLNMINTMRSQSAAFVMPYDIFLMTMLQELMANELGVKLGYYHHFCGSIHYFSNETSMVENIIDSNDYTASMNAMPKNTTYDSLKPLFFFERELREFVVFTEKIPGLTGLNIEYWIDNLLELNLGTYWEQIGYVLIAKALDYLGEDNVNFINIYLNDIFKKLLLK